MKPLELHITEDLHAQLQQFADEQGLSIERVQAEIGQKVAANG